MPCWKCGYSNPMMNAYKYCTECGARLIQECMYCHKDIPVQAWECPHCGRALLRCRAHSILYGLERTRCEISGCEEKLVYKSDVFLPHGAALNRANAVNINQRVSRVACSPAGAAISPVIVNNMHGYFWKAGHNQSKLCCFDFAKGVYVWPEDACPAEDFFVRADGILNFELSGVHLITSLADRVLINLLNDGKSVASVPAAETEYQAWMADNRLFILTRGQGLVYYDPPYKTPNPRGLSVGGAVIAGTEAETVLPAMDGGQAFFVGFDGSLITANSDGEARVLFTPRGGAQIGYLAVKDGYVMFSALVGLNNGESVYELRRLDAETMEEIVIVENAHLACAKFTVSQDSVFTCERVTGGELYFYEYPLSGGYTMNPYTRRWRISKASDVYDFYCAVCGEDVNFLYISRSGGFNLIEAYRMTGSGAGERLKAMNASSQCGMISVYNHVILTDRNTGQMFDVKTL